MKKVIYSSDSQLRSPQNFVADICSDLKVAPAVAWRLFQRNLRAGHRQSFLGYLWLLLPPIATAATWIYLNSMQLVKMDNTALPYPVFVLVGTLLWQVFTEALRSPLQQLSSAGSMITKSRIPHEALLLAGLIEVSFNFLVRLAVLSPVLLWCAMHWNLPVHWQSLLLTPFGIFALLSLGFTLGLLLTPLGLLYQDVSQGLTMVTGFWFLLTPVIYPVSKTGATSWVLSLNPVTPLLNATRQWLTSGTLSPLENFSFVTILTFPILLLTWLFYRLARPHLVARLG